MADIVYVYNDYFVTRRAKVLLTTGVGLSVKMHKIIIFLKTRYTVFNTLLHTSKLSAMSIRIVFG